MKWRSINSEFTIKLRQEFHVSIYYSSLLCLKVVSFYLRDNKKLLKVQFLCTGHMHSASTYTFMHNFASKRIHYPVMVFIKSLHKSGYSGCLAQTIQCHSSLFERMLIRLLIILDEVIIFYLEATLQREGNS